MSATIVAFAASKSNRIGGRRDETIRWAGWVYDLPTVLAFTPTGLFDEAACADGASGQAWWEALADQWPGAALDIVGRLRAAGKGSEEIRTAHSLAVFNAPATPRTRKPRAASRLPERPRNTAPSRAMLQLASTLEVEALGELVDHLVGILWSKHNVAHP